ncbi:Extradiol ring-cleavage dioxygenase, class III enzyme, subunit B [Metschnikowia bicuspidata var. bicuspidata NRRL YB-4993]|uniref:Extradiol ring-cleavage dioxygenase, class III enzyme, subunit B n=1 Tax=Metschnikowia bicuspidata var. bicuspidata NRRL YB-4993 TaxID=869754 RepID=A0A1A0HHS8_9ASCO|nr:Extradiol ring-cleavage dioxygenase, class III enzyme, subunit B [Metschnikowia bicuspidata var. bicuspidata NRRL YB-4993]OBA23714.1 Extradiol ring-cleavage dioxygenase, class III enzyme, subunit B [Metschnikowia bicuspidata var. bicuspidata NRRL YB-4993]
MSAYKSTLGKSVPAAAQSAAFRNAEPNTNPYPALFVSHGGPTFMYEDDDFGNKGAWRAVRKLGSTIKNDWRPDYILVVSAHWQLGGLNLIEVAVPPKNPLIYDFYGFPDHMYKEQFRTWNSQVVARLVQENLEQKGFHARLTERGLDHGVWVPLKVAFPQGPGDDDMALPHTPLIQVSLTGREGDFETHARLGEVLSHFQNNLIWDPVQNRHLKGLVICSGMSVHNLRDLGRAVHSGQRALPYVGEFSRLVSQALQQGPDTLPLLEKLKTEHSSLLRAAHPTLEHFVPLVVAAGINRASGNRKVTELYSDNQLSLAWGTYQFGEYSAQI